MGLHPTIVSSRTLVIGESLASKAIGYPLAYAAARLGSRPLRSALGELQCLIKLGSKNTGLEKPAINNITLPMIKAEHKAPKLNVKAAEARHMLEGVCWILTEVYPPQDDHAHLVLQCLSHMHSFYE